LQSNTEKLDINSCWTVKQMQEVGIQSLQDLEKKEQELKKEPESIVNRLERIGL